MNAAFRSAVRQALGPMTSDSKCDEVVRAVLGALTKAEPSIGLRTMGLTTVRLDFASHEDAATVFDLLSSSASQIVGESLRDEPFPPPTKDVES